MKDPIINSSKELNNKLSRLDLVTELKIVGPLTKTLPIPKEIKQNEMWVFIDGGANYLPEKFLNAENKNHFLVIGDADSHTSESIVSKESFDILLSTHKDNSDLSYFLKLSMKSVSNLTLFGFLGGDLDHELSNIGAIFNFLNQTGHFHKQVSVTLDEKLIFKKSTASENDKSHFEFVSGFSLFSLENQFISIAGNVDYQGDFALTALSSLGLSNKSHGQFELKHQKPILIIKNDR